MAHQDFATIRDYIAFGLGPWAPVNEVDHETDDDWIHVSGDDPAKDVRAADAGDMGRGRSTRHGELESQGSHLKLGNADGRYTPGNNASPHRLLSQGTPFQRLITYPLDGDTIPLWGGIVSNWSADFEGAGSGVARADLQSRVSLLGKKKLQGAAFRDLYSWATYFWPLDDQEGAQSAVQLIGDGTYPADVVGTLGGVDFGLVPAPGGYGTGAAFTDLGAGSEYLYAGYVPPPVPTGEPGPPFPMVIVSDFAVGCWVWPLEDTSSGDLITIGTRGLDEMIANRFQFRFDNGTLSAGFFLGVEGVVEAEMDTSIPHHVMYVSTPEDIVHEIDASARLFIDGVLVDEVDNVGGFAHEPNVFMLGGGPTGALDCQLSQVFYVREPAGVPTDDQVQAIMDVGWETPETADRHWERLCANAGIPALTRGEFTTPILPVPVKDRTVADIAGDIEKFERGRIVVDEKDQLVLMSCAEANKYEPAPLVLLPDEDFNIDGGPALDSTGLVNTVSVILPGFGVELNLSDEDSIETHGEQGPGQDTVYLPNYVEQWSYASWLINTRATPKPRIPVIVMSAERLHQNGKLSAVLGLREGDVIQLGDDDHRLPAGMGRWMIIARVDQISHQFGDKGEWTIRLTVVDYAAPFVVESDLGRVVDTPGSLTLNADLSAGDEYVVIDMDPDHPPLTADITQYPMWLEIDGEIVEAWGDGVDDRLPTLAEPLDEGGEYMIVNLTDEFPTIDAHWLAVGPEWVEVL